MPTPKQRRQAGVIDVSDFGERDIADCYPPGTQIELDDGTVVDLNSVPNVLRDGAGAVQKDDAPMTTDDLGGVGQAPQSVSQDPDVHCPTCNRVVTGPMYICPTHGPARKKRKLPPTGSRPIARP